MRTRQRGATLLEALVAFLVLALGMVSMARLQTQLRLQSDVARQRSEAVRLAQEDLERLRAFTRIGSAAGISSFADIGTGTASIASVNGQALNTRYELRRQIEGSDAPRLKAATVSVAWNDRQGQLQRVVLDSVIAGHDPALSSMLSLRGSAAPLAGVFGRGSGVPPAALDLGDGRSAFKPQLGGDLAWLFDNRSGQVVARCSGVAAVASPRQVSVGSAASASCAPAGGLLLSGVVRFAAPDVPLPLAVTLSLDDGAGGAPECLTEARKVVRYVSAGVTRREAVPLDAQPANVGAAGWVELGERFVAYTCIVPTADGAPRWSGRSRLRPQGWAIGTAATERRICRHSADQDGSGSVDSNAEHPERYVGVDAALVEQNFLVVRGDQPCPAAAGPGAQVFSNLATVQHQP